MKPNKDFRLSKTTKRMLCNIPDQHKRGEWKRLMIDAEIAEKQARMAKISFKTNQGDE
jgi:hypothetical protein